MKKTYSEYVEYVKAMLGVVDDEDFSIEFDNSALTKYVKIAFTEVKPYINARHRITLPWNKGFNGAIDFKEHDMKVKSVTTVRRGTAQGYLTGGTTLYGSWSSYSITPEGTYPTIPIFTLGGSIYSASGSLTNDPWSLEKLMIKGINETAGDKHFIFDYDKQLLFINFNTATPKSVTIDYVPDWQTAEDVDDSYWTMLLQQKALAVTKLALSQYRGKFQQVTGSPFMLDYNRLQIEGQAETQRIQEILEENLQNYRFD